MKNRTLTVIITSILLVMGLTSCGDLLTAGFETPADTNYCTISGHISNPGSAVSRSAFPTLPDGLEYIVYAENTRTSDTIDGDVVEDSFAISDLTIGQTYVVHAEAYDSDGNLVMEGTSPSITLSSNLVNIDPITLSASQTGSGWISLEIKYTGERNLYITMSLDNQEYDPLDFEDGVCLIEIDPVPAGTRNLNLCVWEDSLPLFQYTDKISVYQNKCTDTWVNNSNNSGDAAEKDPLHKNEDGTADFILTDDILNFFEKTAIYVDTKVSQSDDLGTFWQPFKTISKAFEYAQASSSTKTTIFIKNGSSEEINGSTELRGKRWNIQAYTDIPGDGQGNATLTFTDGSAIVFCLFGESELSATGITFKGTTGYQSGSDGGFVYIDSGCEGTFNTCSFTYGNSCDYGGAIANFGECTLNGCTFSNNQAETAGGAIFSTGTLTISGTTTIENNISDGNKNDFLSFYGNLTLDGTLNFKDSERFEFHKGNDYYSASSVTLVEGLSVTGSAISKIPLYYDGDPSGSCFFTSDSISKAKEFFTVESPLEITDDGKIAVPTPPISLTCDGQTSSPETLDAALSAGGCSKITLTAGYTYDCTGGYFENGEITLEVLGEGTATVNVKGCINLWSSLTFSANKIAFIRDDNYINTQEGGLFFINCQGDGVNATFTKCTFKNGLSEKVGGALYVQGNVTLEDCTFENNKMKTETPNDIVVWYGSVTLKGKNSFSSPICCNSNMPCITVSDISLAPGSSTYASISCFDWLDEPYAAPGCQIISGLTSGQESWFPCADEGGYAIDSDGKILKSFSSIPDVSDIATGSTVILTPDSGVSASDITKFLSSEGDFKVNLDLSNLSAADIKNIDSTLEHVDTLTLPGGNYVSNLYGQDQSAGGGKALGLRKVIIKGDIPNKWLFQNCTGIEEVVFEEGCTTIPAAMFAGCENLKTVTLPSTLKTIEWQVFRGTAIEEITIPASVTTIQNNVFYLSDPTPPFALTKVIFEDTEHHWSVRYKGTGDAYTDTYGNVYSSISVNDSSDTAAFFQLEAATQGDYWLVKNEQITPAAADVGDIILSDGSVIQYSEGLTLTAEQKANAIAVIFYKGTELNNDGNTSTVRTLGIGLQQASNLMWCTTDASGYSLSPDSMVCELASSSTTETSIKPNTHRNGKNNFSNLSTYMDQNSIDNDTSDKEKYPAFYFAIDYADSASNVSGTAFENDWYLPSMAELLELYNNKAIVNTSLEKCGGTQLSGSYRSSSPGWGANNTRAYSISMNDGLWSNMVRETTFKICAIIEFN